jgi:hypothetical protein
MRNVLLAMDFLAMDFLAMVFVVAVFLPMLGACGSPSGMVEAPGSANPAPANEPDTEPLPPVPKKKIADPRVPLDAGHGK